MIVKRSEGRYDHVNDVDNNDVYSVVNDVVTNDVNDVVNSDDGFGERARPAPTGRAATLSPRGACLPVAGYTPRQSAFTGGDGFLMPAANICL